VTRALVYQCVRQERPSDFPQLGVVRGGSFHEEMLGPVIDRARDHHRAACTAAENRGP